MTTICSEMSRVQPPKRIPKLRFPFVLHADDFSNLTTAEERKVTADKTRQLEALEVLREKRAGREQKLEQMAKASLSNDVPPCQKVEPKFCFKSRNLSIRKALKQTQIVPLYGDQPDRFLLICRFEGVALFLT